MNIVKIVIIILSLIFSYSIYADADQGELYGYKLGEEYKEEEVLRIEICGSLICVNYMVPRDKSHKEIEEMWETDEIWITVSLKSRVIGTIESLTFFDTKIESEEFIRKYANLLSIKYDEYTIYPLDLSDYPPILSEINRTVFGINFTDKYILTIMRSESDQLDLRFRKLGKWMVRIGINLAPKKYDKLFRTEAESVQKRLYDLQDAGTRRSRARISPGALF